MSNADLILTLGKVIIAAAWADGTVTQDEINSLKDLTFKLPELTTHQWAELEIYIETPVDEAERGRLINNLKKVISTPADRALAVQTLDDMVNADGTVTAGEQKVVDEVKAAIDSADKGIFGKFSNLLDTMFNRRAQALAGAPNREAHFEDYIKNKVYYNVQRRLEKGETELDIPDAELRKLCMAGGIMAQIAGINDKITDEEFATIVNALQSAWNLNQEQSTFVTEVALLKESAAFDHLRLAREFVKVCTHEEAIQFLDVLFQIAAADGHASSDEMEQIRKISAELLLSNKQFIEAKKKVPRQLRQQ